MNVAYSSCLGHGFGAVWKRVASFSFPPLVHSGFTDFGRERNAPRHGHLARDPAPKAHHHYGCSCPCTDEGNNSIILSVVVELLSAAQMETGKPTLPTLGPAKDPQRRFLAIIELILS